MYFIQSTYLLSLMVFIVSSLCLLSCSENQHDRKDVAHQDTEKKPAVHWGYDGEAGPEHWGTLKAEFRDCANGKKQSPINLVTSSIVQGNLSILQCHYQSVMLNIVNNGHTIQANYEAGSFMRVNDMRYDLLQFHFHTPSEHTVNSSAYAMEMHLVHKSDDGNLAVIGVFIEKGSENRTFKPIWDNLPKNKGDEVKLETALNVEEFLPAQRNSYRYIGSLTTPPCSEIVSWFVIAAPVQMSNEQLDAFKNIFRHNARPVEGLNGRVVTTERIK